MPKKQHLAAGTLVWRVHKRRLQVLLVHRPRYDDWAWPKGKLEAGESLQECAVRETAEETGHQVKLGRPLGFTRYTLPSGNKKTSHYWAAQVSGPDAPYLRARGPVDPASLKEIDETRWVTVSKARKLLTYERDHEPLDVLVDLYDDERLRTWTVVIARHGRAKKRKAWAGEELTRPLTPVGTLQARDLVGLMGCYGVDEIVTSPWERCAATVRPYAETIGVEMDLRSKLTEADHAVHPLSVRKIIDGVLADREGGIAICTHRPVMPSVLEAVKQRMPNRLKPLLPKADPWLKPGECLLVHMSQRPRRRAVVVAIEYVKPRVV